MLSVEKHSVALLICFLWSLALHIMREAHIIVTHTVYDKMHVIQEGLRKEIRCAD
jgi:hypothetical protein